MAESSFSRRQLLCGTLLAGLGLALDALPDTAQAATGVTVLKSGKVQVSLKANKQLAKVGGAVIVPLSDGSDLAVVRTATGVNGFTALSLTCPHMGGTVNEIGKKWVCPLHGSTFALNGALLQGPAQSGLSKYPLKATAQNLTIG
jgi:Rieske Fe-S protein